MDFKVSAHFFEKVPAACFYVVITDGIHPLTESKEIYDLLKQQVQSEASLLQNHTVKELPFLQPYHVSMQAFEINPNRYQCSVEALLNRVAKKGDLPDINPLVNLGNYLSIKYKVPLGVHDKDSFSEDMMIRLACEEDCSIPENNLEGDPLKIGEPVYASGHSVRTRRWLWRQMDAGRIGADATNLFFPVDGFKSNEETLINACKELAAILEKYFGCTTRIGMVDAEHPSFKISELTEEEKNIVTDIMIKEKVSAEFQGFTPDLKSDHLENISHKVETSEENICIRLTSLGDKSQGEQLADALIDMGAFASKSELRRVFQQGGAKLNGEKINDLFSFEVDTKGVLKLGKNKVYQIMIE